VALHRGVDDIGHQLLGRRMRDREVDVTAPQRPQVGDLGQRVVEVALAAPDRGQHDLAGAGQLHAAGQAIEQRGADLLLEVEHLLVHRGGREVQRLAGLADRAAPRDLVETAERLGHGGHRPSVRILLTRRQKQSAFIDVGQALDSIHRRSRARTGAPA
jgi:hypothetical protein